VVSLAVQLPPSDIRRLGDSPDAGTVHTVLEGARTLLHERE
jgi:hypothetical protein